MKINEIQGIPETFEAFLECFGPNPKITVTFRNNLEMSFFHILTHPEIFIISKPAVRELTIVAIRRKWWDVSRTVKMELRVHADNCAMTLGLLNRAVEKIEVIRENGEKTIILN